MSTHNTGFRAEIRKYYVATLSCQELCKALDKGVFRRFVLLKAISMRTYNIHCGTQITKFLKLSFWCTNNKISQIIILVHK